MAQHIAMNLKLKAITANMGCIPKDMAESILFGHEKGAFTGAVANKIGLIEAAHGGLFFLDEIGECPMDIQTKLLRTIQEKEVQPLGALRTRKVDVRFIAATNCDLDQMVKSGKFRLDLLQRLNTFVLKLPALRERPEDISFYANLFLEQHQGARFYLTADGEQALLAHSWPGNIRELRSVIERIVVLSSKMSIDAQVVNDAIQTGKSPNEDKAQLLAVVENNARREEVVKAITENNGCKRKAALKLGVSEATLYRLIDLFRNCPLKKQLTI